MHENHTQQLSVILSEMTRVRTTTDAQKWLAKARELYGVKSIAYFAVGVRNKVSDPYLLVTYSQEWIIHYTEQRYLEIDPVIANGFGRLLPIDWSDFGKREGQVRTLFGEASEFGLGHQGLTIPVHGKGGDRALLTITSDLPKRGWDRQKLAYMRDFQVLAVHLHNKVLELEGWPRIHSALSPRERECLQWIAEGKTAWECAIILGISQHTVRCYLESARYKLGASSNTHAVSLAHKAGLFSPAL